VEKATVRIHLYRKQSGVDGALEEVAERLDLYNVNAARLAPVDPVLIPRCATCLDKHREGARWTWAAVGLGVVCAVVGCSNVPQTAIGSSFPGALILAGVGYGAWMSGQKVRELFFTDRKPLSAWPRHPKVQEFRAHPAIQTWLDNGFQIGVVEQ
jgi:hypothetical protein